MGDVHGCFLEFQELLKKISYNRNRHRLILVGDVINRGPDSWKTLQWIRANSVEMIRGNHEEAFITYARRNISINSTLDELKRQMADDLEAWLNWMESLPLYVEEKDFIVVHAGRDPGRSLKDSDPGVLLYVRTWDEKKKRPGNDSHPPWYEFYKGKKLIVYGHWAKQGLTVRQNTIGLDSACVYGKKLSGLLLPERKIVQISARKNYCSAG